MLRGDQGRIRPPAVKGKQELNAELFDAAYYRHYYGDPRTAIITPEMQHNEVAFVLAFCRHIGLGIRRFTDAGAGTGWWRDEFLRQHGAQCDIETFDASADACMLFGHRRVPLEKLAGPRADLIICRDVLRYLDDASADEAIRRLARKCRGVLYLHVVTRDDDFDTDASDTEGWFRPASWYRKRLREAGFRDCGMGLFLSHRLRTFAPWALEAR